MADSGFTQTKVDEIHDEVRHKEEKSKGLLSRMSDRSKLWLALLVGFIIYTGFKDNFEGNTQVFFLAGIIIVAVLFSQSGSSSNDVLDEQEIKARVFKQMKFKQTNSYGGEFEIPPDAKIFPDLVGRLRWMNYKPWKYDVAINVRFPNSRTKTFLAEADPYTGKVYGYLKLTGDYTGKDSSDLRYIESPELRKENRWREAVKD